MKYLLILLIMLGLTSCEMGTKAEIDTRHTIEWISASDKPIIVTKQDSLTGLGNLYGYTLRNPKNTFYFTGLVSLKLPDTIK